MWNPVRFGVVGRMIVGRFDVSCCEVCGMPFKLAEDEESMDWSYAGRIAGWS